ncbi:MAG: threonine aldolase [Bradymonadia bacterium]|jgi:threonine aldolase
MEAARYMPSGCMAQPIALRIWAERSGLFETAFHATSHLEIHEERGYAALHGLTAHLLGDPHRPTLAVDLDGLPPISSLLLELPAREIGGQLPTWEQLGELCSKARALGIRLHLDGARLWEAQAFYQRPFSEICALFDSVYVSFYKTIGALAGAMLLGPRDFIEEAIVWQRRQGGTVYSALANIVSAQIGLEEKLERMSAYRERAAQVASIWAEADRARVLPDTPQVNMFHLILDGPPADLLLARDRVAESHGIWLINSLRDEDEGSRCEVMIGEAAMGISNDDLRAAIAALFED